MDNLSPQQRKMLGWFRKFSHPDWNIGYTGGHGEALYCPATWRNYGRGVRRAASYLAVTSQEGTFPPVALEDGVLVRYYTAKRSDPVWSLVLEPGGDQSALFLVAMVDLLLKRVMRESKRVRISLRSRR